MAILNTPILVDTNVCIDLILQRKKFVTNAAKVFRAIESNKIKWFVAAHVFDTIFYIVRKKKGTNEAYESIRSLRSMVSAASVNEVIIDSALQANWRDFEDAIHHQVALKQSCKAIITRNALDFSEAEIPAYSPTEFVEKFLN